MTNAIAVTDQEHPDHQLGIDRGPPDVAVKRLQLLVQIGQNGSRENIDPSQQVVRRDHLVEAKLVKQLPLISILPPHHRRLSCRFLSRNHCSLRSSTPFSTASTQPGHSTVWTFVENCLRSGRGHRDGKDDEATRVHHAYWRRDNSVAAYGASAAVYREDRPYRVSREHDWQSNHFARLPSVSRRTKKGR